MILDAAAFARFLALLDRPVRDKPRLRKLMAEPSIFDGVQTVARLGAGRESS